jgi:hypothetical protein
MTVEGRSTICAFLAITGCILVGEDTVLAGSSVRSNIIILGGGTNKHDALKVISAFSNDPRPWAIRMPKGYPAVFDFAAIEGLNPGFKIAVGGFCKSAKRAKRVRDYLKRFMKGVYLKKVKRATDAKDCPHVLFLPPARLKSGGLELRVDETWQEVPGWEAGETNWNSWFVATLHGDKGNVLAEKRWEGRISSDTPVGLSCSPKGVAVKRAEIRTIVLCEGGDTAVTGNMTKNVTVSIDVEARTIRFDEEIIDGRSFGE